MMQPAGPGKRRKANRQGTRVMRTDRTHRAIAAIGRTGTSMIAAGILVTAAFAAAPAGAQTFPAKPIKMIVPYTPGSPVDVLARVVTQQAAAQIGQPVVM